MMDSAEKGKAYDQAIMPVQMLSQVPYFSRDERRQLLPSITLKEVMTYRDALKPVRDLNSGHWQYERSSDNEHGAGYPKQLGANGSQWCRNKDVVVDKKQSVIFEKSRQQHGFSAGGGICANRIR